MQRLFAITLVSIIVISWNKTTASPVEPVRTMAIPYADTPPALDGVADQYYGSVQTTDYIHPNQYAEWDGEADFSAEFRMCWDFYNLYVLASIRDDVAHVLTWDYSQEWMFDNFEVFLQLDTNTVDSYYGPTTTQLRVNRGLDSVQTPGRASRTDYGYYMDGYNATGWVSEIAIPWTAVLADGDTPDDIMDYFDVAIGFDFSGSDSDNTDGDETVGNRDFQTFWDLDGQDGTEDGAWNNTRVFGYVELLDGPVEPPPLPPPPPPPQKELKYIEPLQSINIPPASSINLDGRDYESSYSNAVSLDLFNSNSYSGWYDLSGTFKTCWDMEYLYLYVNIRDDYNQSWTGVGDVELYDNIEVYLDVDTAATDTYYKETSTAMIRFARGQSQVMSAGRAEAADFEFVTKNVQNEGWVVEAAIPWKAALPSGYTSDQIDQYFPNLGFDIIVNDRDEFSVSSRLQLSQLTFDLDNEGKSYISREDEAWYNTRAFGIANLLGSVGINDDEINNTQIVFFPNPARNYIYFDNVDKITRIELFNTVGMLTAGIQTDGHEAEMDISSLEQGTYLIKFYQSDGGQMIKLITVVR